MQVHDAEALIVKPTPDRSFPRLGKKLASLQWQRIGHWFAIIIGPNAVLWLQLFILIQAWGGLARAQALHNPPSIEDYLMKESKWALPLLFLLSLIGHLYVNTKRSCAVDAAKIILVLPYNILLIVCWILLVNYEYERIVPSDCSYDNTTNRTSLRTTLFDHITLANCVAEFFPGFIRCEMYGAEVLNAVFNGKPTTLLDFAYKYFLLLCGVGGAAIHLLLCRIFDNIYGGSCNLRARSQLPIVVAFTIILLATFGPAILTAFTHCL